MSRENVEIAEAAYGDAPITDSPGLAPHAEFDFTSLYPDQPVLHGIEEMRRFRDHSPWEGSQNFEPQRFLDVDEDRVLVLLRVTSRGRSSGVQVATDIAHELTFRDGMIVRVKIHRSSADGLAAVGLED
jgi:hypothetical protein